jgi:geranylgeranyl diphosphate synthase type I
MTRSHCSLIEEMQSQISIQLMGITESLLNGYPLEYQQMVKYQLGLDLGVIVPQNRGKRLRPLFVLLTVDLFGSDWHDALPAAVAVELLHNFSLVHDDIQDGSETRRGRKSVWKVWGIPQAINTGDALLNLAYLSILRLPDKVGDQKINAILHTLHNTCLKLTKGQYFDMVFEKKPSIPLDLYWQMVEGKTASLLSACFRIGAIIANAPKDEENAIADAGRILGLAFQIQDDYLGIWGNEKQTGKSINSDLITRKKTYPVILGEDKSQEFASIWQQTPIVQIEEAQKLARLLENDGIKEQVIKEFKGKYLEASEKIANLRVDKNRLIVIDEIIQTLEKRTR